MTDKVLIVDDQKGIRLLLEEVFREEGWQVCCVSDGQAALRQIDIFQPNLILMDVRMPNMSGLEAARAILQLQPVPIIMMTAYGETDVADAALAAGIKECIIKPFDIEKLRSVAARFRVGEIEKNVKTI